MKRKYSFLWKTLAASLVFNYATIDAQLSIIASGGYEPGGVTNSGLVALNTPSGIIYKWDPNGGLMQVGAVTGGSSGGGRTVISHDGTKIATSMTNQSTGLIEVSLYNIPSTTWTNLGGLGSSSGTSTSSTWGISGDGSVVVGLGWISAGTAHAVKWQNAMVDLGSMVPNRSSRANGANFDGTVIVGWQDEATGTRRGAKWVDGTESYITDNSGNLVGEASAVSADGNTIIGQAIPNPYVWNSITGLTYINHPNAGSFFRGGATAISADGNTVVGYYRNFPGPTAAGEGFIWTPTGGRVNLNTYATNLGINLQGVKLSLPLAISPDGRKIAGIGLDAANAAVTFYLDVTAYLSIRENALQNNGISIYPNPVKDILYIKGAGKIGKAEIYNMTGQIIRSFDSVKDQMDISFLPKGNYVLEFSTKEGRSQSLKLIKQ